jgi:K+-transporting ATPase ATPase B chain
VTSLDVLDGIGGLIVVLLFRAMGAAALLRRNLAIYGLGGLIVPFVGVKLIDGALAALGWV